jgi:DNA-binding response OmpR family regulator
VAKVLLVEDETILRRVVARALRQHSYDVVEADSVATADAALQGADTCFDVAVLDINLPDLTGWDVLRHVSARSATTAGSHEPGTHHCRAGPPVIVMSAVRPTAGRMAEFRPAGVLLKPFPIDALMRLLRQVLLAGRGPDSPSRGAAVDLWSGHTG